VCEDEMLEQHAKENDVEREYEKEQVWHIQYVN
jgi:hypothetical protein